LFRPGHIVLDGDPAPPLQMGTALQFSVHVCCGQTVGCIKMPLGTKVVLGSGHIVLDGDPASTKGAFVRDCGQGSSLLWTPTRRPSVGPVRCACPGREEGNWLACASVCVTYREGRLSTCEQLVGYLLDAPPQGVAYTVWLDLAGTSSATAQ